MPKISILDRIKQKKSKLIELGADPDSIAIIMSDIIYHKMHRALQGIAGKEILILESFEGMEIIVHEQCDDDQIFIIDKRHWEIEY